MGLVNAHAHDPPGRNVRVADVNRAGRATVDVLTLLQSQSLEHDARGEAVSNAPTLLAATGLRSHPCDHSGIVGQHVHDPGEQAGDVAPCDMEEEDEVAEHCRIVQGVGLPPADLVEEAPRNLFGRQGGEERALRLQDPCQLGRGAANASIGCPGGVAGVDHVRELLQSDDRRSCGIEAGEEAGPEREEQSVHPRPRGYAGRTLRRCGREPGAEAVAQRRLVRRHHVS